MAVPTRVPALKFQLKEEDRRTGDPQDADVVIESETTIRSGPIIEVESSVEVEEEFI